jgi:hypothetical protein
MLQRSLDERVSRQRQKLPVKAKSLPVAVQKIFAAKPFEYKLNNFFLDVLTNTTHLSKEFVELNESSVSADFSQRLFGDKAFEIRADGRLSKPSRTTFWTGTAGFTAIAICL